MAKKRILITGKGSYVGTSFIKWLSQWPDEYEVDEISVRGEEWKQYDFSQYDSVIHLAAIVHQRRMLDERSYYDINAELPYLIANKAASEGVKQFIFFSSMAVYGLNGKVNKWIEIDETTPCRPVTPYGKSKLLAEHKLESLKSEHFYIAVLRPPMIYGDECKGNYMRLRYLVNKLTVFPDIDNQRSLLHIKLLCSYIKAKIDTQSEGLFFPQDLKYSSTKELLINLSFEQGRSVKFTKLFNPFVSCASFLGISSVDKLFGNLVYSQSLSSL